jgi:uncharacterized membrane protein YeaQ/YmgE (transglycosylase-associated protein family)
MGILLWSVFGLIAGAIAKFLRAGKVPGGFIVTIILGIVGAVVGGFVGAQLRFGDVSGFDLRSMLLAIGGGVLVLFIYGLVSTGRASLSVTDDCVQSLTS